MALIKDPMERLATEISLPLWLTKKLVKQIGIEETSELGYALFEPNHASGRIDLQRKQQRSNGYKKKASTHDQVSFPPMGLWLTKAL